MKKLVSFAAGILIVLGAAAQTQSEIDSFERIYNQARTSMQAGDWQTAKAVLGPLYKSYGKYSDLVSRIDADYRACDKEITKAAEAQKTSERLALSESIFVFDDKGGECGVIVTAGAGNPSLWEISDVPDWCEAVKIDNLLKISAQANPDPAFRLGEVTLQMKLKKKTVVRQVSIMQAARPLVQKKIRVITEPSDAMISLGTDSAQSSPVVADVTEGSVPLFIQRTDYADLDTIIVVTPEAAGKTITEYRFSLKHLYSVIKFDIKARSGYLDDKNPQMFIDGRKIDLAPCFNRGTARTLAESGRVV